MDYQEIEELLFTDLEVRQETEETRRRRVRSTRRRTPTVAQVEPAAAVRVEQREKEVEAAYCPTPAWPIQWPVRAYEPLGEGIRMS